MKLLTVLIGLSLRLTSYRFSKTHRQNETIIYRLLNTTAMNQIANGLTVKQYFLIYK